MMKYALDMGGILKENAREKYLKQNNMKTKNIKFHQWVKELQCRVFGHKRRYNFPSLPNKAICTRCKVKEKLNLHTLKWEVVAGFCGETRTDKELCDSWIPR